MSAPLTFRPIRPADRPFLFRVFSASRPDIHAARLPAEEKQALLRMQFEAQHQDYTANYPDAAFLIVMLGTVSVGRLYLHRRSDEIRVVDIALLPEFRNRGLGTTLMLDVLREGELAGKPVRIHVEKFNRAMSFYQRLGFTVIRDVDTHFLMECAPPPRPTIVGA